jgi:phosphomethylpyrimidine synthase
MHYARQGIVTPEMEFVAIRENLRRKEYLEAWKRPARPASLADDGPPASGPVVRRRIPAEITPEFVREKSPAAAPSSRPTSTTRKSSR